MKIALVYDAVYPYIKGGGEKRFYDIARELANRGNEVHIYGMKLWAGLKVVKKEGIYYHGAFVEKIRACVLKRLSDPSAG